MRGVWCPQTVVKWSRIGGLCNREVCPILDPWGRILIQLELWIYWEHVKTCENMWVTHSNVKLVKHLYSLACKPAYNRYMLGCQPLANTKALRAPQRPFRPILIIHWRAGRHSVYHIEIRIFPITDNTPGLFAPVQTLDCSLICLLPTVKKVN